MQPLLVSRYSRLATIDSVSAVVCLLVSVTVCAGLLCPDKIVPKFRLPVEAAMGATPVPDSPTACGLVPSLSTIVIAPGYARGARFAVG